MVIDTLKHSVLGKFNDVRPGIYREYMKVSLTAHYGMDVGERGT